MGSKKKQEYTLDERLQDALDQALTDAVCRLVPFLSIGVSVEDLAERFARMVSTHFHEELRIISEGPECGEWGDLSDQTQTVMYLLGLELAAKKEGRR